MNLAQRDHGWRISPRSFSRVASLPITVTISQQPQKRRAVALDGSLLIFARKAKIERLAAVDG